MSDRIMEAYTIKAIRSVNCDWHPGAILMLCDSHEALRDELARVRNELDWQNMPNRNPAARGGYEFYINEEWTGVRHAAMDDSVGTVATLMKARYDPDDDRVRVRLIKDDDALLSDLAAAVAERDELREALQRLIDLCEGPSGNEAAIKAYDEVFEQCLWLLAARESAGKGDAALVARLDSTTGGVKHKGATDEN